MSNLTQLNVTNFEKMAKTSFNSLQYDSNLAFLAKITKLPNYLHKFQTKKVTFFEIFEQILKVPIMSFLKMLYTCLYFARNFGTRAAKNGGFQLIFFTNSKVLLIKISKFSIFLSKFLMYMSRAFWNGITLGLYLAPNFGTLA